MENKSTPEANELTKVVDFIPSYTIIKGHLKMATVSNMEE